MMQLVQRGGKCLLERASSIFDGLSSFYRHHRHRHTHCDCKEGHIHRIYVSDNLLQQNPHYPHHHRHYQDKMFQGICIGKIISTIITIDIIKIEIFQGIYISKIIPGGAAAATGISTKNVILAALIMMMGMKIIMMVKTIVVLKAIIVLTLLRSGKLRMGDRVLAVNTTDIRIVTHQEAVMALLQHCQVNWTTETVIKVIIINQ